LSFVALSFDGAFLLFWYLLCLYKSSHFLCQLLSFCLHFTGLPDVFFNQAGDVKKYDNFVKKRLQKLKPLFLGGSICYPQKMWKVG